MYWFDAIFTLTGDIKVSFVDKGEGGGVDDPGRKIKKVDGLVVSKILFF